MTRKAPVRSLASFQDRISVLPDGTGVLSAHTVRLLLNGELLHARCDLCGTSGYVHGDDDGENTRPGRHPEGIDSEVCPECFGLGYVIPQKHKPNEPSEVTQDNEIPANTNTNT